MMRCERYCARVDGNVPVKPLCDPDGANRRFLCLRRSCEHRSAKCDALGAERGTGGDCAASDSPAG